MYKDTLIEGKINNKINELKQLLCDRYDNTKKIELELQFIREIYSNRAVINYDKKIEELKNSENVNIRILVKNHIELSEKLKLDSSELDRLREIEKKYNIILENLN